MSEDITPGQCFGCPHCFAVNPPDKKEPPHGWYQPCPWFVKVQEAYIEKLEAERAYYSSGGPYGDMLKRVLRR